MLYSDLKDAIDLELSQESVAGYSANGDYATVKDSQLRIWLRESLMELSSINSAHWYKIVPEVNPSSTNRLIIPQDLKVVRRIAITPDISTLPSTWHPVNFITTTNTEVTKSVFRWLGGSEVWVSYNIDAGQCIWWEGHFYPAIPKDGSDTVDFPREHERLLVLSILLKKAGRDNVETKNWYYEHARLLKQFQTAYGKAQTMGHYNSNIIFRGDS